MTGSAPAGAKPSGSHRRHLSPARPYKVLARFSEEERALIVAKAERAGLTPTTFVAETVAAALRDEQLAVVLEYRASLAELNATRTERRRVGANLNQAVAAMNAGIPVADTIGRLAKAVDHAVAHVDAVTRDVGRRLR